MFTKNFKINVLSVFFMILFPLLTMAQLNPQWVYRYNGSGNWTANITTNDSKIDALGNLYLACSGSNTNSSHDIVVMKFSPHSVGNPLWVSVFTGIGGSSSEIANALILDNSGNIYVTGQVSINNSWDVVTLKYNNSGQLQWARQYSGTFGGHDEVSCITLDPAGNVIVGGKTYTANGYDYLTIKYSTSGLLLWARTYDGPSTNNDDDVVNDIASDASGNIIVTGKAGWTGSGYDIVNIKYSPTGVGGATRYDGAEHDDDEGKKILFDRT